MSVLSLVSSLLAVPLRNASEDPHVITHFVTSYHLETVHSSALSPVRKQPEWLLKVLTGR